MQFFNFIVYFIQIHFQFFLTPLLNVHFVSINSIKLQGDFATNSWVIRPILPRTNIQICKFSHCKQHFLRLVNIPLKNIFSVFICDPTILNNF
jgi:hypothetical protein